MKHDRTLFRGRIVLIDDLVMFGSASITGIIKGFGYW